MSLRSTDVFGVGLALVTAAVGVVLWGRLPSEMAIHFGVSGDPDNYAPRAFGVFFLPVLMVGLLAFVNGAARLDPPEDARVFRVTKLWTLAVLAFVQGFVLAWNLGYELPMSVVLGPVLGSALVLVVWSYRTERGVAKG